MTFAASGITITQSGTDANVSSYATFISGVANAVRSTTFSSGNVRKATTQTATNVFYWYQCTTAGTSGATEPAWPVTSSATIVDNIQPAWTALTAFAVNARRQPTAGASATLAYRVSAITTGITAAAEPTWPVVAGNTVVDGGVTWIAETALIWTTRRAPMYAVFAAASDTYTTCTTGDFGLLVSGTFTINPRKELFISTPITGIGVDMSASATLNIGAVQTQINGLDWYERGIGLISAPQAGSVNPIRCSAASAVINIRGATVLIGCASGSAYFLVQSGGRVNVREGTIEALNFARDARFRNEITGDIDAIGLRLVGVWPNKNKPWINASGIIVENESGPELNTSSTPAADSYFEEISFDSSKTVAGFYAQKNLIGYQSPWVKVLNSPTGSNLDIQVTVNSSGDAGVFEVEKLVDVTIKDAAGTGLSDGFLFIEDTLNGASPTSVRPKSRSPAASGSGALNFGPQRSYSALSVAGVFPQQRILTAVCHTSANNWAYRGKGLTNADLFDVHLWRMGNLYTGFPNSQLLGAGSLTLAAVPPVDATVVVTARATVAAYASIATLDQLRDYLKYMKTTIGYVRVPTPETEMCTSAGGILTIPYDLVFDPSASAVVDVTGGTMTVKGSVLAAGTLNTSLVVTGTVTLNGGAAITVPFTDSTGKRVIISGWPTGTLAPDGYNRKQVGVVFEATAGWTFVNRAVLNAALTVDQATGIAVAVLDPARKYLLIADAHGYYRSDPIRLDTANITTATIALSLIAKPDGTEQIDGTHDPLQVAAITFDSVNNELNFDTTLVSEWSYSSMLSASEQLFTSNTALIDDYPKPTYQYTTQTLLLPTASPTRLTDLGTNALRGKLLFTTAVNGSSDLHAAYRQPWKTVYGLEYPTTFIAAPEQVLTSGERSAITSGVWAEISEAGQSYGKQFRDQRAVLLGVSSGGGTATETFAGADGVTPRVISSNNGTDRTAVSVPGA